MSRAIRIPQAKPLARLLTPEQPPAEADAPARSEHDEMIAQGWRLVGRDEKGRPIYAPPASGSIWLEFP
jgi:hypothetical protein